MDDILGEDESVESVDPNLLRYADELGEEFGDEEEEGWEFEPGEEYDFGEPEMAERRYPRPSQRRGYAGRLAARRARMARLNAMRRRRRQQQMSGRRRPRYPSRRPSGRRPAPASTQQVQKVAEGVKNVDLDNKVLADLVSKGLNFERKRITRNQQAFMASQFLDQVGASLDSGPKPINWLSLAPMALMIADKKKPGGAAGVLREPWAWAIGSVITLLILTNDEWREKIREILGGGTTAPPPAPPSTGGATPQALQDALTALLTQQAAAGQQPSPQTAQQMAATAIQQAAAPAIEQAAAQMLQQAVAPAVQQAAAQMVQQAFEQAAQQAAAPAARETAPAPAAQQAGESTAKKSAAKK